MRQQLFMVYFAARDPRAPSRLRLLALAVAAYAISPIDLIPDFIPVAGWLDDLVIVPAGIAAILHWMPADVIAAARERAQQMHGRFAGYFAAAVVMLLWLIALRLLLGVALTHLS